MKVPGPLSIDLRRTSLFSVVVFFLLFIWLFSIDRTGQLHLLFHTFAELFSIIVAVGIFIISWNTRRFSSNRYLVFLGIAFLYIGILDLLHTLSYRGMQVFPLDDADPPTQFWIAARYLQALSFLIAPHFFARKLSVRITHAVFLLVTALVILSVFVWDIFPESYRENIGLTPFKIVSEYLIILLFLLSIPLLHRHRQDFDRPIFLYLTASLLLAVASEFMFTLYINLSDIPQVLGHYFKVLSFFYLYKAIIETTLWHPYSFLFRNLEEQKAELSRQKMLLENAIEALTHPFTIIDVRDYGIVKANSAAYSLAREGDCRTCHAMAYGRKEPCDTGTRPCPLRELMKTKAAVAVEHVHLDGAGNMRYYEVHGYPIFDAGGDVVQMIEYSLDITDRRIAQARLEAQTVELERSNDELRQFAYIASHDLQEPLRMVSSYVQLLAERYRGRLDPDADDFIGFAVDGANRMRDLINALLSFSRIGTHAKPGVPVDMASLMRKTLSNLEVLIGESNAAITVDPLPPVSADETQVLQLFQNLIGNAVKFRSVDRPPRIHVGASRADWMIEFFIRDNGIGIDARHHTRIFQIFQRLHTREAYPGTGIGLTICRKIVERHGGTIRLESREGEGTVFYFTLPAVPASGEAERSGFSGL